MKSHLLLSSLVIASMVLTTPSTSLAGKKLKLRPGLIKDTKDVKKPTFRVLSAKSMKSWGYGESKKRKLHIPKGALSQFSHPVYRQSGVLLGIGKPYNDETNSTLKCFRAKYDKALYKDIKFHPNNAAASIGVTGNRYVAEAVFGKVGKTPRLFMVTLGVNVPIRVLEVKVSGATLTSIPTELWQWNATANQYQALVTITPNSHGYVTFSINSNISDNMVYVCYFHHIQLMMME